MNLLRATSSPHVRDCASISGVMFDVVIALMPAMVAACWFFGWNALALIIVSVLSAVGTEALIQKLSGKKVTVNDWSAVVTGILLAFNLPSGAPLWMAVIGSVFAIGIVKQLFGGLGHNFMNPALAGRAFLLVSRTAHMTTWTPTAFMSVDAFTGATPLAILKGAEGALPSVWDMFIGNIPGCLGETSALALLIGAVYLLCRRVISWRIPIIYIATTAIFTWIFWPEGWFTGPVLYQIFGGGLILGAFFMATDYASSPVTPKGQIIYALGCGLLTAVIRLWGGYPEGVSFAILLMNVAAPLIDKYTRPHIFGEVAKRA
ncbi:RnfABCDGE type electron transport complex subunit D [Christensenellaceae bacterium NSJ-44]|uniref:Ion-translocating oxidoreductase complex subunit D n=1 Tax=Luoshenia tenuis TaxID=2763654 RepID=A0A926HM51_9FIRM|nr:RnfABCDGE type electron transport complex subunit D [Luoshenia tenuis]MBC8529159.1 RnfABCDGE type electron transport complex subunit D [Luoshenia tenuis]